MYVESMAKMSRFVAFRSREKIIRLWDALSLSRRSDGQPTLEKFLDRVTAHDRTFFIYERELLISGICGACFDDMFRGDALHASRLAVGEHRANPSHTPPASDIPGSHRARQLRCLRHHSLGRSDGCGGLLQFGGDYETE